MSAPQPQKRVLLRGGLGFFVIVALCWLVEFLQIPHLYFGEEAVFNWPRVLFRTAAVGVVWLWVYFTTKPLLDRLHHLEEFIHVCSWCRKFGHQGKWLAMEDYFGDHLRTRTSHGICPECAKEQFSDLNSLLEEPSSSPAPASRQEADQVPPSRTVPSPANLAKPGVVPLTIFPGNPSTVQHPE